MSKLKAFVKNSFIGGVLVLLPVAIVVAGFKWIFGTLTSLIQPLTSMVVEQYGMPEALGDALVTLLIALLCFLVGFLVSTGFGHWLHSVFDKYLLRFAPGYKIIKEITSQFFGDKESSPFSNGVVARARIFGEHVETSVTGLVTAQHEDGFVTVFVPTGPNPTSGNMYHLPESQVELLPGASVEDMMRTIIGCGTGSDQLFNPTDVPVPSLDGTVMGTVKWFSTDKGYGFIELEDGQEIFVHYRSIKGEGRRVLRDGQRVSLNVVENDKGPQAENVSPVAN